MNIGSTRERVVGAHATESARRNADAAHDVRVIFAGGGTGGHLYPGIAIARALVRAGPDVQPFFVGAQRGIERDVLPTTEFPHLLLDLHPLYRQQPWKNWRTVRGAGERVARARERARAQRPAMVVGTGGYAAGIALAYARMHGIPIQLQEQDSLPGLTARSFARWARGVYLDFPEARRVCAGGAHAEIFDTGTPIEPPPRPRPIARGARVAWGFPPRARAGAAGLRREPGLASRSTRVAAWIERGLPAGVRSSGPRGRASYDRVCALRRPTVCACATYLAPISDAYAAADLALARAGAMTMAELCAWGIPSMLVPLPTAAADHQRANARALEAAGAAVTLPQSELSAATLGGALTRLLEEPAALASMAEAAARRGRPDAAERIATWILGPHS